MSFSRLSTGTKLTSKTQKIFKKVSVLDLIPVQRVQKQLKKTFQKTVKMYLVPASNLKKKKKSQRYVFDFPFKRSQQSSGSLLVHHSFVEVDFHKFFKKVTISLK
jgi:hypothetical protein